MVLSLTIAFAMSASSQAKLDVFALPTSTPEQAALMLGEPTTGQWTFNLKANQEFDIFSLQKTSMTQMEKVFGKGELTYATYTPKVALKKAHVQIAFSRPSNSFVLLEAVGKDYNWKMLLEAFGVKTEDIASDGAPNNSNFKEFVLRIADPRLAQFDAKASHYLEMENEKEGIVTIASVHLQPKQRASRPALSSTSTLSISKGEAGVLQDIRAQWPGTDLTPEMILSRCGIKKGTFSLTMKKAGEEWMPGTKLWEVQFTDPKLEDWGGKVIFTKNMSYFQFRFPNPK